MITFEVSNLNSPNEDFLKKYSAMHVYEDEKGEKYLFLGKGKSSEENLMLYKEISYLYMNINYIQKFIPKNMTDLSELFRSIQDAKDDIGCYIKSSIKPIWALKDLGKLYDYRDEQIIKRFEYSYRCSFMNSYFNNKYVVDLEPNSYVKTLEKDKSDIYCN